MPSENNTPAIRFAGFTGEWEKRKLGDMADGYYGGGTPSTSNQTFWGGRIPWIQSSDVSKDEVFGILTKKYVTQAGINNSATRLIPQNSIAIVIRVGVGKLAYIPYQFTTSQDFLSLSHLKTDPFFTVYACYNKLQSDLNAVQGTSIKGITKQELLSKIITLPQNIEQQKIGLFIHKLDTLITLHRRKCELLETLKKSMLEKLFPKEGELVPELRFAGFTGEWEPLKLEELCVKTTGGGTPSTSMTAYWNGEIPWFQSSDFKDGVVSVSSSNKHISPAGLQKSAAHLIPANSIAIVTRVGFGKLALIPFEYTTSQDLLSLSYLGVDPLFGVYSIYKKLQSELMAVQGTSIKGITKEDLLAKDVLTSRDQDEQQKIGVFLSRIDTLLTLHRRKLELLQNIKKACLEKMFV